MKKLVIALAVLLLAAGGWFYASPLWTLRAMRNAAVARDGAALSHYVDYAALRTDLKGDLRRSMMAEVGKQSGALQEMGPFGAIGMAIAMKLVDPMIEAMVTPEGVEAMFARQRAEDDARSRSMGSASGRAAGDVRSPAKPSLASAGPGEDAEIDRVSVDEFRVQGKDKAGALIFRRHGLGWKLSAVDIPGL